MNRLYAVKNIRFFFLLIIKFKDNFTEAVLDIIAVLLIIKFRVLRTMSRGHRNKISRDNDYINYVVHLSKMSFIGHYA